MTDYLDDYSCHECGNYTPDGSWCDECLDEVDIDLHEEQRRGRISEEQEY